jgi:leader peptidase (prepilin peptidase)/N-methyltransferase
MPWLALLTHNPLLLYGITALFALLIGSFLNVVVYRLPRMLDYEWRQEYAALTGSDKLAPTGPRLTLARPGSHCPRCGHTVRPLENIPLISYLCLHGRCSACGGEIGLRYPMVEAFTAFLSVLVVWRFGIDWETIAALILTWGLIALALIDYDTKLLPDAITLPLLWLGLVLSLSDGWITDSRSAILGATLGYLSLWGVFQVFRLLTGKEGMGFGDFKLFALFGAWLGWQYLPQILLLSACAGAIVGLVLNAVRGRDSQIPIPFGPFLAAAGWLSMMWGDAINQAYFRWAGLA